MPISRAKLNWIYYASDGQATTQLYKRLERLGPKGIVALNLFRAQKASARAKVYRGGRNGESFKSMAYSRKRWSIENLCKALLEHGKSIGVRFGWGKDKDEAYASWVFFVDLPTGQVSFHSPDKFEGPTYDKDWDGVKGASISRIVAYCESVLNDEPTGNLLF